MPGRMTSGRAETEHWREPSARNSRSRRLWRFGLYLSLVLVGAFVVSSFISLPYEAITPGSTVNVAKLITVPGSVRRSSSGSIALVDVNLIQLRAANYLFYRLNHDNQVVSTGDLLGTESQATYNEQGVLDMLSAQQAATYLAFREMGYPVHALPDEIAVYAIAPNSPASSLVRGRSLQVGDVVLAIDKLKISGIASLRMALSRLRAGDHVNVMVRPLDKRQTQSVKITLGSPVSSKSGAERCATRKSGASRTGSTQPACLGIVVTELYSFVHQPFQVRLSSAGIIGPSAGLAFTLGLMKELDPSNLTGGLSVAASGTISMNGTIGDVGGVAQKTVAVRDSGADVFFVPEVEYRTAESYAGSHLRVMPVSSISQVIRDLKALGGRIVKGSAR